MRKSTRKNTKKPEYQNEIAAKFCRMKTDPDGFVKAYINENIGHGVFALKDFNKRDFLMEYRGNLITRKEGIALQSTYEKEGEGSFIFFFDHNGRKCLDATRESSLGRYVNDSPDANCQIKKLLVDGVPHLCLFALNSIVDGTELRYDYDAGGFIWWRKDKNSKTPYYYYNLNKKEDGIVYFNIDYTVTKTSDSANGVVHIEDEEEENTSANQMMVLHEDSIEDAAVTLAIAESTVLHEDFIADTAVTLKIAESKVIEEDSIEDAAVPLENPESKTCSACRSICNSGMECFAKQCADFGKYFGTCCDHVCRKKVIKEDLIGDAAVPLENAVSKNVNSMVENLNNMMFASNIKEATSLFQSWVKSKKCKNPPAREKKLKVKTTCPICNEEKYDLKLHLMRMHKFKEVNALALKSQMNLYKIRHVLADDKRKSRKRAYQRRNCPFNGCAKVVTRLDNHLRQTHKVKDSVVFKKLMKSATVDLDGPPADDGFSDQSDDEQMDIYVFKDTMKKYGYDELKQTEARESEDDSDDPDWLTRKIFEEMDKKERKKRIAMKVLGQDRTEKQQTDAHVSPSDVILDSVCENILSAEDECLHLPSAKDVEQQEQAGPENEPPPYQQSEDYGDEDPESGYDSAESEDDEDEELDDVMTPISADQTVQLFQKWLEGVDGNHKNERCARQMSRQILFILKKVSPSKFSMIYLFNRILLRDNWLTIFDKIRKPGTVRTYLGSLRWFYHYVICDRPENIPASIEECYTMLSIIKIWSATYKKKMKLRKFEKQLEDLNNLLKPEELHQFDNSELVDQCRQLLKSCRYSPNLKLTQFTSCRDYILTSLILSNASRPGALQNMTLKEFETAFEAENGVHLISVKKHKTAATSGPAMIAFSGFLYDECLSYLKFVRNKLPGVGLDPKEPVFISWSGKKMSSSLIGDQFSNFFGHATNNNILERNARKLTATLVRKSYVSKVHSELPELKRDLSHMMCHSVKTADESYFLEEKTKNVAKTFTKMQTTMRANKISKEELEKSLQEIYHEELLTSSPITLDLVRQQSASICNFPMSEKQIRDKLHYMQRHITDEGTYPDQSTAVNKMLEESVVPEDNLPFVDDSIDDATDSDFIPPTDPDDYEMMPSQRVMYIPAEEKLFKKHFKSHIENANDLVRKYDVLKIIHKHKELTAILQKYGLKRILFKVRSLKKKYTLQLKK